MQLAQIDYPSPIMPFSSVQPAKAVLAKARAASFFSTEGGGGLRVVWMNSKEGSQMKERYIYQSITSEILQARCYLFAQCYLLPRTRVVAIYDAHFCLSRHRDVYQISSMEKRIP